MTRHAQTWLDLSWVKLVGLGAVCSDQNKIWSLVNDQTKALHEWLKFSTTDHSHSEFYCAVQCFTIL